MRKLVKHIMGPYLSRKIIRAQLLKDTSEYQKLRTEKVCGNVQLFNGFVQSTQGAAINFQTFSCAEKPKRVLIFAEGNASAYEKHFDSYLALAEKYPDYQIVAFNFRNVLASRGHVICDQDWVDDVKAVIGHVKSQGYANEDILVSGHSMGGALTTIAVNQLYQEELKKAENPEQVKSIRLINNRSFSNLAEEIMTFLLGPKWVSAVNGMIYGVLSLGLAALISVTVLPLSTPVIGFLGFSVSCFTTISSLIHNHVGLNLFRPWMRAFADIAFGRMDAEKAYRALPENAKEYIVAKRDSTILKPAGLHHALKMDTKLQCRELVREMSHIHKELSNERLNKNSNELVTQLTRLQETFLNIRDRKIEHSVLPKDGKLSHNDDLLHHISSYRLRTNKVQIHLIGNPPVLNGMEIFDRKINRLFCPTQ